LSQSISPNIFAILAALVALTIAGAVWIIYLLYRAVVRFGEEAEETSRQLNALSERINAMASLNEKKE